MRIAYFQTITQYMYWVILEIVICIYSVVFDILFNICKYLDLFKKYRYMSLVQNWYMILLNIDLIKN